jgi:hypothetical protein
MTNTELEELGFITVVTDINSFVSKTNGDDVWLEVFYSNEPEYLQIMRGTKGDSGEILRNTIYEGQGNIVAIKQFLK